MRKLLLPPLIGVTAFAVGILATIIWFGYLNLGKSYEKAFSEGVNDASFCDLKNNPYKYNGEIVRIRTTAYWNMHGIYLTDKECSDRKDGSNIALSFYKSDPTGTLNQLTETIKQAKGTGPIPFTAIGRFRYAPKFEISDSMVDRTSYQFEIYNIESVSK